MAFPDFHNLSSFEAIVFLIGTGDCSTIKVPTMYALGQNLKVL